jgi:hypothetical protein
MQVGVRGTIRILVQDIREITSNNKFRFSSEKGMNHGLHQNRERNHPTSL